jgi:hypothetical protein
MDSTVHRVAEGTIQESWTGFERVVWGTRAAPFSATEFATDLAREVAAVR